MICIMVSTPVACRLGVDLSFAGTMRTLSSTESLRSKSWCDAELIWRFLFRRQCTDRWMDGLLDRWMDRCKHIYAGVVGWRAERQEKRKRAREEHWSPR